MLHFNVINNDTCTDLSGHLGLQGILQEHTQSKVRETVLSFNLNK